jgi:2-methylisocitrate lyase-like PEP mutase family enzyme
VLANAWDAGSAIVLESLGFAAIGTTSAGLAFSLGRPDGRGAVGLEETLANATAIAAATALPVSADLENGLGHSPEAVADAVRRAAAAGVAGASIEDTTGDPSRPIADLGAAVDRVHAAVEANAALDAPLVLTARADGLLHTRPDLGDVVTRLQAFQEAGADVLYAPGIATRADIASVVAVVDRPVNVLMGLIGFTGTLADLEAAGVSRVSLGSSLARAALGALRRAGEEIRQSGRFSFAAQAAPFGDLAALFAARSPGP